MTTNRLPVTIVGGNGDVIDMNRWVGPFGIAPGARGFGIPPTQISFVEGAGDGSRWRNSRVANRDVDLPVLIFGDSRTDVHRQQRRLARALRRRTTASRSARLQWTLESGAVYELPEVYYVTGAETQIGQTGTDTFSRWLLTLRAPDPYWEAVDAVNLPVLRVGAAEPFLPDLAGLHVASSQVLGSLTVENPGDVPCPVVWRIHGPVESATFTRNDGLGFSLGAFDGDTVITVNTRTKTVTDQAGANRYALLGPAPKLFDLPGGTSVVGIEVVGAESETTVTGYYKPRLEVVY